MKARRAYTPNPPDNGGSRVRRMLRRYFRCFVEDIDAGERQRSRETSNKENQQTLDQLEATRRIQIWVDQSKKCIPDLHEKNYIQKNFPAKVATEHTVDCDSGSRPRPLSQSNPNQVKSNIANYKPEIHLPARKSISASSDPLADVNRVLAELRSFNASLLSLPPALMAAVGNS